MAFTPIITVKPDLVGFSLVDNSIYGEDIPSVGDVVSVAISLEDKNGVTTLIPANLQSGSLPLLNVAYFLQDGLYKATVTYNGLYSTALYFTQTLSSEKQLAKDISSLDICAFDGLKACNKERSTELFNRVMILKAIPGAMFCEMYGKVTKLFEFLTQDYTTCKTC